MRTPRRPASSTAVSPSRAASQRFRKSKRVGLKLMKMSLRRIFIPVVACVLLMQAAGARCFAQTLREQADKAGVLVGAAVEPRYFAEPLYAATLAREFNMLSAENAMKWGAIRPDRATFNFGPGDRIVAFAREHRMKVRGHCLAWSEYNPGWLLKANFTPAQMSDLLREHITK